MKVPFSWLKEYIPLSLSVQEVSQILTLLGIEVESIIRPEFTFSDVVVGEILTVTKHPHADRLQVTTVTDGKEVYQVVCGAKNCRAGLKVAFAKIGAKLKDLSGKEASIKKSKLRDIDSFGMLCAADELGLGTQDERMIMELAENAPTGADLTEVLSEPVLEISLTPNLGHCLSLIGIARELAAHQKISPHIPQGFPKEDSERPIHKTIEVTLEAKELCSRYACRYLYNIQMGPSPDWLKNRLEAAGLKSINNIVDIGNYVMFETGQPLHMFDAKKIQGAKIIIHTAKDAGSLTTLDGNLCAFPPSTLLISDAKEPIAIAGVMGGLNTAISPTTTEIVIESAAFDGAAIRTASKRLNLRSDSSYRFERGIDKGNVVHALNRAAALVSELAQGIALQGSLDLCPFGIQPLIIPCRIARINSLLGLDLSHNEICELFTRLGMGITSQNIEILQVEIPSFRNDLKLEIDLVEEIARLYGYNEIPKQTVRHISAPFNDSPLFTFECSVRNFLLREGLQEWLTCDLISLSQASCAEKQGIKMSALIEVLHPRSIEQSVLRHSLLPGLLQVIKHNQDEEQRVIDIAAFEVGKIHFQHEGLFQEQMMAGIILSGKRTPYHFQPPPSPSDFFDSKGIVENLCLNLHLSELQFTPSHFTAFHPFRQASISARDHVLGIIGEIHPELLRDLGIKQPVFFAEIDVHTLFPLCKRELHIQPLPAFPGTERDWTVTLQDNTPIATLFSALRNAASPLLADFFLLDIYKSEQLGAKKKNVTVRLFYRDPTKTLAADIIDREHAQLIQRVAQKISDHVV